GRPAVRTFSANRRVLDSFCREPIAATAAFASVNGMGSFAAVAASIVLLALAFFQLALVFGAPLGRFAWGGQHEVLPANLRIGSAVSIVLYALFVVVLLDR